MRNVSAFIILSLLPFIGTAQSWHWARALDSETTSVEKATYIRAIKPGPDNTFYVLGITSGSFVDFGNEYDNNSRGSFIAKYVGSTCIWRNMIGTLANGRNIFDGAEDLAVDDSGNVYVVGTLTGTAANPTYEFQRQNAFGDEKQITVSSIRSGHTFLVKYDPTGYCEWLNYIEETYSAEAIGIDADNNVYIAGQLNMTAADFGNGVTIPAQSVILDAYLAKYNSGGTCLWATVAVERGNTGNSNFTYDMAVNPDGEVYLSGEFRGTNLNLNNSVTMSSTSSTLSSTYLAQYDSSGDCQWVNEIGSTAGSGSGGTGIELDDDGNAYLIGYISGANYDFGNGNTLSPSSASGYLAKYTPAGDCSWAIAPAANSAYAHSVTVEGFQVYLTGRFSGTNVNFGNSNTASSTGSADSADIFLAEFDSSGTCQNVEAFGGTGDDGGFIATGTAAVIESGDIIVGGSLNGTEAGADDHMIGSIELAATDFYTGFLAMYTERSSHTQTSAGNLPKGHFTEITVNNGLSVSISGETSADRLKLGAGATLTVGAGEAITVYDTIENYGTITVEDGGSLILNGGTKGSGTFNIKRTGSSDPLTYNYWSNPIIDGTYEVLDTTNLYQYNAFSEEWIHPNPLGQQKMFFGIGYITTGSGAVTFSGADIYPGSLHGQYFTYLSTLPDKDNAFGLIGNPHTCGLDINKFLAYNGQLTAVYLWDDDGSGDASEYKTTDYTVVNRAGSLTTSDQGGTPSGSSGNYSIASCQGFFVANGTGIVNGQSINFNADMHTSNNSIFFKSEDDDETSDDNRTRALLELSDGKETISRSLMVFLPQGTDKFDNGYDAPKFDAGDKALRLYTMQSDNRLAIQALPVLSGARTVYVGFNAPEAGHYTISLAETANLPEGTSVILEDTKTGRMHDFDVSGAYVFTVGGAFRSDDRFVLHFNKVITTTDDKTADAAQVDIYATGTDIILNTPADLQGTITVRNVLGQTVASQRFSGNTQIDLSGQPAGVYVVTVQSGNAMKTEKVVIR